MKFSLPKDFEEFYYGSYDDSPAEEAINNINKLPAHLQLQLIAHLANTAPVNEQELFAQHLKAMSKSEKIKLIHELLDTL